MHILENIKTNGTNVTSIDTFLFTNVSIHCKVWPRFESTRLRLSVQASLIKFVCTLTPIIWIIIYCFYCYDTYLKDRCFRSKYWCDCFHCLTSECAEGGCRKQNRLRRKMTSVQVKRNDQLIQELR